MKKRVTVILEVESDDEINMDEKVSIEFTKEAFEEILEYQKTLQNATVQSAVLNAIRIALYDVH